MLGNKKTLSLWRPRRSNYLAMERALNSPARSGRHTGAERIVIGQKASQRRFEEAKGKVRPPA